MGCGRDGILVRVTPRVRFDIQGTDVAISGSRKLEEPMRGFVDTHGASLGGRKCPRECGPVDADARRLAAMTLRWRTSFPRGVRASRDAKPPRRRRAMPRLWRRRRGNSAR